LSTSSPATMGGSTIRLGRDSDADAFIALIAACWALYPGVRMDVDGEMPELRALASYYQSAGGALWLAEDRDNPIGMIATRPLKPGERSGAWEICRVYVDPAHHGSGAGHALLDVAEAHAVAAGASRLVLWSDTRFERAHQFYEKRSFVRCGPIRVLADVSQSLEFAYGKPVNGIELLDAAAAASAERSLVDLLVACVDAGASVSFLPPLPAATARAFWKHVTAEIAAGTRLLLAGWAGGSLLGAAMLDLGTPPNQPHRAEVQKLLVHPNARRKGLGRALMQWAEQEAVRAGRSLLTLDTKAGDAAEALYRANGWQEAGRIPGYALNADGTPCDTVLFWKIPSPTKWERVG